MANKVVIPTLDGTTGADGTTTTVPQKIPAKKTAAKKSTFVPKPLVPVVSSSASDGSTSKLKLPDAEKLESMGLPKHLAKLVAGEKIDISTYDGEPITGTELLTAIDSISTDTFDPTIARAINEKDVHDVSAALSKYLGIDPNGTYSQQEDAADIAAHNIPSTGKQAGDLNLVAPTAPASNQTLEEEAQTASEKESLKVDQAEIDYYHGAASAGNNAADTGATASAKYTAEADADSDLTNWGIDTPEMNNLVEKLAAAGMTNQNEILQNIRATSTYKKAFAGLAEYNAQPGHVHMTESEYRTYSQSVLGAAQQYGVPKDFITQDEIGTLLKGNVSASEFQQRVEDVYSASSNADAGVKADLQKWYGIGPAQLATFWANPAKALPVLQRQVASAEIGDYAARVGLKGLDEKGAQQLAQQAKLSAAQGNNQLGTGVSTIEGSLLNASKDAPLLGSLPGAQKPAIDTDVLIGSQIAGFGGTNQVAAQTDVERAEQAKAAPFERGGGYAQSEKGVVGVGAASS